MGITAEDVVDVIKIVLTYPKKYREKDGTPTEFVFYFGEPSQDEVNAYVRRVIAKPTKDRPKLESAIQLDELAEFLAERPEDDEDERPVCTGFDDFPRDERPLSERAREYFGRKKFQRFVNDALEEYWKAVKPAESFR